jgi:hypothetical protein
MTTYRTMDTSDLGDNCDSADLGRFRAACAARQRETGETDEVVTEWMWAQGDWDARCRQYEAA